MRVFDSTESTEISMASPWPENVALFVGGPWHGEMQSLTVQQWPAKIEVKSPSDSELHTYEQSSWIWIDEKGNLESRTIFVSPLILPDEVEPLIRSVEPRAGK
jgi:hypothetical protein